MSEDDKETDIKLFENVIANDNTNDNSQKLSATLKSTTDTKRQATRLSRWFVSNQKTDTWDEKRLNTLHRFIITLLVIMYVCHILASPFTKIIDNTTTTIVIINVVEVLCLIVGISSLVKMFFVNGSLTATKMIFDKGNVRTYIYIFWIIRSFIIEFLKGQIVYSFVVVYHSIVLYSSDMWYICNRKYLILNFILFLSILLYEFFISISPVAPSEPSWVFMNIKTTANSLSRSNQFNLFVIFFDALIIIIYDVNRSKYVMLVKKKKRFILEMSSEKKRKIMTWWKVAGFFAVIAMIIFVSFTIMKIPSIYSNITLAIPLGICLPLVVRIIYSSSSTEWYKILCMLVQERRVIFQYILLGILFYIDNFYLGVSTARILFPIIMTWFVSLDFIGGFFPRRFSMVLMTAIVFVLVFSIFNHTFLKTDCEEQKLEWGIYGEEISYCAIKRVIYQTVLSLMTSAFLAISMGRTDNLFFCNANIYRSSGTINRTTVNANYVRSMSIEQRSSGLIRNIDLANESKPSYVEEEDVKFPDHDDKKADGMVEKGLRAIATAVIGV